jgi:hypothetical protein
MVTITLHWITWTLLLILTFINGWQLWGFIRRASRLLRKNRRLGGTKHG